MLNDSISAEDGESFVPCYPAPVDIQKLVELNDLGSNGTTVRNMASWYGVLAAYATYAASLTENSDDSPRKLLKLLEILEAVLNLFTDVVSIYTHACTDCVYNSMLAYYNYMHPTTENLSTFISDSDWTIYL